MTEDIEFSSMNIKHVHLTFKNGSRYSLPLNKPFLSYKEWQLIAVDGDDSSRRRNRLRDMVPSPQGTKGKKKKKKRFGNSLRPIVPLICCQSEYPTYLTLPVWVFLADTVSRLYIYYFEC